MLSHCEDYNPIVSLHREKITCQYSGPLPGIGGGHNICFLISSGYSMMYSGISLSGSFINALMRGIAVFLFQSSASQRKLKNTVRMSGPARVSLSASSLWFGEPVKPKYSSMQVPNWFI